MCSTSFHRLILIPGVILFFIFLDSCEKETVDQDPVCLLKRCDIIRNWDSGFQIDTIIWEFEYDANKLLSKYTTHSFWHGHDDETEYFFTYDENEKVNRIDQKDHGYLIFAWLIKWSHNKATMEMWRDQDDSLVFDKRKFVYEFNSRNELEKLSDYNIIENPEDENSAILTFWDFNFSDGNMIKMDEISYDYISRTNSYTYDPKKNPLSELHLGWFFDFDLFLSRNNILTEEIFNHNLNEVTTVKSVTYTYNEYGYPVEMISSQVSPSYTRNEIWKFEYDCDSI
jgi:hypothetical protein